MSGNFLSCSKGVKDLLEFPEVKLISFEKPQRKWASSRLEGTSRFSRGASGALDLRRGPQGPALVASGNAIPDASFSGASRDFCPFDAEA